MLSLLQRLLIMSTKNAKRPKPVDLAYSYMRVADQRGKNDDVPIILIHGLTMHKESWTGFHEELSLKTSKSICTFDLRNHGESPWSNECDVEAMTEDVIHLMDKLEIPKGIILGFSFGAKIAVHLALNYPKRIEKVIVEDMRPNGFSAESLEEVLAFFRIYEQANNAFAQGIGEKEGKDLMLSLMNDYLSKMNQSEFKMTDTTSLPVKYSDGKWQLKFNPIVIAMVLNDFMDMLSESTGRFDGPSLFIYGTESNFKVKEDESNIKNLFPNATIHGVKGATHSVHMFPEFLDTVVKFIKGN